MAHPTLFSYLSAEVQAEGGTCVLLPHSAVIYAYVVGDEITAHYFVHRAGDDWLVFVFYTGRSQGENGTLRLKRRDKTAKSVVDAVMERVHVFKRYYAGSRGAA